MVNATSERGNTAYCKFSFRVFLQMENLTFICNKDDVVLDGRRHKKVRAVQIRASNIYGGSVNDIQSFREVASYLLSQNVSCQSNGFDPQFLVVQFEHF